MWHSLLQAAARSQEQRRRTTQGGLASAKGLRQHLAETRLGTAIGRITWAGKIVLHDNAATLPGAPTRTIGSYSVRHDPTNRTFLTGPAVASMKGDEIPVPIGPGNTGPLRHWAGSRFADATGSVVTHPELGDIRLNGRAAKDTLGHGYSSLKVQGLFLLPAALRQARVFAEESREDGQIGWVLAPPSRSLGAITC